MCLAVAVTADCTVIFMGFSCWRQSNLVRLVHLQGSFSRLTCSRAQYAADSCPFLRRQGPGRISAWQFITARTIGLFSLSVGFAAIVVIATVCEQAGRLFATASVGDILHLLAAFADSSNGLCIECS